MNKEEVIDLSPKVEKSAQNYANITRKQLEDTSDNIVMSKTEYLKLCKMASTGELLCGAVHNINNHLTAVEGFSRILKMRVHDEHLKRYSANIINASQNSATLIRNALNFSRNIKVDKQEIDIHKSINDACQVLVCTLNSRVNLHITLDSFKSTILGFAGEIENAVLNLGINARDAMPQGGNITIKTDLIIDPFVMGLTEGEYITISVEDDGYGINQHDLPKIYESFFTTKKTGTGIGLATVHKTIKSHGGAMTVESEENSGAKFIIYLPLLKTIDEPIEIEEVVASLV